LRPESDDPTNPDAWIVRAIGNLSLARGGRQIEGVFLEDLCFNAQQAAKKALKAVCVQNGLDFPKTHSLVRLMDIIEVDGITIPQSVKAADVLTQYAVDTRYPGYIEEIEPDEYRQALDLAETVLAWAEEVLSRGKD
jgi:HEPN domain-containing protein